MLLQSRRLFSLRLGILSTVARPYERSERATVGGFEGRVIHVDRFGTLITNITRQDLFTPAAQPRSWRVSVNNEAIGSIRDTFHDVPPQRVVALIGSGDLLEIAVNQGSALERFGPPEGIRVEVR